MDKQEQLGGFFSNLKEEIKDAGAKKIMPAEVLEQRAGGLLKVRFIHNNIIIDDIRIFATNDSVGCCTIEMPAVGSQVQVYVQDAAFNGFVVKSDQVVHNRTCAEKGYKAEVTAHESVIDMQELISIRVKNKELGKLLVEIADIISVLTVPTPSGVSAPPITTTQEALTSWKTRLEAVLVTTEE